MLPLPRLYTAVSVRTGAVTVVVAFTELSHIPLPIGQAEHALAMRQPVLIHLALISAPTTILQDLDLRRRSAHSTSHHAWILISKAIDECSINGPVLRVCDAQSILKISST